MEKRLHGALWLRTDKVSRVWNSQFSNLRIADATFATLRTQQGTRIACLLSASMQSMLTGCQSRRNQSKVPWAGKMEKAVTLVMLQKSAPARKLTTWIHAPSQPLM